MCEEAGGRDEGADVERGAMERIGVDGGELGSQSPSLSEVGGVPWKGPSAVGEEKGESGEDSRERVVVEEEADGWRA